MDFTYAGYAAIPARRLVRFMAKQSVFRHPVSGPLMRGMKHIPVDRAAGSGSYHAAVDALRRGEIVGVFPEATISRSFELKTFKNGAARMAQEAGVPMLPMTIWGSQRVWTKGLPKRLGRTRTPISIAIGPPVPVAPGDDVDAATASIHEVMEGMLCWAMPFAASRTRTSCGGAVTTSPTCATCRVSSTPSSSARRSPTRPSASPTSKPPAGRPGSSRSSPPPTSTSAR